MSEKFHIPAFPLARTAGFITALVLVLAAAVAGVLWQIGRADMIAAAMSAAGVCLVAAIAALLPMWLARDGGPQALPGACLGSIVLRVTLSLGGALMLLAADFDRRMLGAWIIAWYLLLLIGEVMVMARFLSAIRRAVEGKEVSPC